jgi:ornithine cyclodeaminase
VGAGVQGLAHLEAFHEGFGVAAFGIASRSRSSAVRLVAHAQGLGLRAWVVDDANAALADYPLIVTTTSAQQVALHAIPHPDAFIAAVGAFTPSMVEWAPEVCRHIHNTGTIVVDSRDADHEAGDLLQAGLDVSALPTLGDVVTPSPRWAQSPRKRGPVFFKSCGWAGWDLAAAQCMVSHTM